MQGIELAMLFCHAGFSVKTILSDGAEEQISSELLKEITGHAPWSKLHKPNWVKADIKYAVGVIFGETIPLNLPLTKGVEEKTTQSQHCSAMQPPLPTVFDCQPLQSLASPNPASPPFVGQHLRDNSATRSHPVARLHTAVHGGSPTIHGGASKCVNDDIFEEYIKEHCGFIKVLLNKESALNQDSDDIKKQIILLPDNPLNLRRLFEKILSETFTLTAAKALDGGITYRFEGDFSKIDYVKDLEKAFAEGGIDSNDGITAPINKRNKTPSIELSLASSPNSLRFGGASRLIISNGEKEIEVVLEADKAEIEPTKNRIYVSKHKNGLLLIDSIETRLLPDFSCQSCYSRLVNYIKVELTRLDY